MRINFAAALCVAWSVAAIDPVLAQQFDGARYVWRTKTTGGGYSVTHYEIKGSTVVRTIQGRDSTGYLNTSTNSFPLTSNFFTYPLPTEWCLEAFSTTNCGIRGTLGDREIRFTTVINGRDIGRYMTIRFMWDLEPAKRQH